MPNPQTGAPKSARKRCPSGDRWPLSEREDDAVWVPCGKPDGHDGPHLFKWEWAHDRAMPVPGS